MKFLTERKDHWEKIYSTKQPGQMSWTQEHCVPSLNWIEAEMPNHDAEIIDVGAGVSGLTKCLMEAGYTRLSVVEISEVAIKSARDSLGHREKQIDFIVGDVLNFMPPKQYDIWHDRALFHFFTSRGDRERYLKSAQSALKPNGKMILATFSPNGPGQCSGLAVMRFDERSLVDEVGTAFKLTKSERHVHRTPWGAEQEFLYCVFVRV